MPQQNNNNYAIKVAELTQKFGNFVAVNHVSFEVPKGEIFGFLGANGAGKTTVIRMLTGLLRPTNGTAIINGYDVTKDTEKVKKTIGYMSQKFSLYDDLTTFENMRFFGGIYGLTRNQIRERSNELIEEFSLQAYKNYKAASLPIGLKQRLSFSTALIHSPAIIFLDEPTSGVDPVMRRQFWETIYKLSSQQITVFVTTHNMDEAEYCERVSIMVEGNIKVLDTPQQLKKQYNVATMDEVFTHVASDKNERA